LNKTIGIDMDDVLNCLVDEWILNVYNREYNDSLTMKDVNDWDITKYIKAECGNKVYDILLRPNFFEHLLVKEYAQEVTKRFSEKYELYIITAYSPQTVVNKVNWLAKYFPHIDPKRIIFCNTKGLIKVDYLIDDGLHNITDYINNGGKGPIIFDRPWNRKACISIPRVKNWLEIEAMLQ